MTLDEAIKHAEEVAEENQRVVDTGIVFNDVTIDMLYCDDTEVIEEHLANYQRCAEEHRQLAEWLKDYKRLLEKESDWIPVSERLPEESIPVILTIEIPVFKDKPRREVVLASYHRFCKDKYKWLTYEDEPSIIDFPIAWMPLPESYKLQESEG